jgi:hypothetical protein
MLVSLVEKERLKAPLPTVLPSFSIQVHQRVSGSCERLAVTMKKDRTGTYTTEARPKKSKSQKEAETQGELFLTVV